MRLIVFLILVISFIKVNAGLNDDILLKIHDRKITKDEFLRIYNKNNNSNTIDNKSVDEYLDLFINFKLKVIEAEELGYDTLPSFIKEFEGYKEQLVKPYLTDQEIQEELVQEAYERMQYEVKASHIMVQVDENALPEDTLKAWERINEIRARVVGGEPFDEVARAVSDDPSAKKNDGYLGYFTVFRMVYPFESAAFETEVGKVSDIVRTRFGYHIVKVHDKIPARGEIKVSHIMKAVPRGSTKEKEDSAKTEIFQLYERLKNGVDFAKLAMEHSDDRSSGRKGGELPWFSSGRMIETFADAAFALENNGDISEPLKTSYGWHIIKRIDKKDIPSFEDAKPEILSKIAKDKSRTLRSKQKVINQLKEEYNYAEKNNHLLPFYNLVDSSIYKHEWSYDEKELKNKVLFTFSDEKYTQNDFADFLAETQSRTKPMPVPSYVDKKYNEFVNKKILEYEESHLNEKYPEYRYLVEEYHDGILLFNLTDDKVWSKAVEDTTGLEKFYEKHKSDYMWDTRVDAMIVKGEKEDMLSDVHKMIRKSKNELSEEDIINAFCDTTNMNCLSIENDKYSKGDNEIIDKLEWKEDLFKPFKHKDMYYVVNIKKVLPPTVKKLNEARGLITADYQEYLEKEWIKELRNKYKIEINKKVLSTML